MADQSFINISGYRFVHLDGLAELQSHLKSVLSSIGVKGAVVLASEGINVTLAGTEIQIKATTDFFETQPLLAGLWFKRSQSDAAPHRRLRVRIRTEIISFDGQDSEQFQALRPAAPVISPQMLDQWLDHEQPVTLLDTRNDYEIVSGTFKDAVHLDIKHFKHFKQAAAEAMANGKLDPEKPIVTFCTGGIRCEKAAPWLLQQGFKEVYQIEGGVINYLRQSDAQHWQGDCFVFDERVELDRDLQPTGAGLCDHCQLAVPAGTECQCQLGPHYHASHSSST